MKKTLSIFVILFSNFNSAKLMPAANSRPDVVPWPHFQIQTIDSDENGLLDEKQLVRAPFLEHATNEQTDNFKKLIMQNRYTLKNDIEPMIDSWAAQQGGAVQADYNEFKKDAQTAGNLFVTAVNDAAISDEAKEGLRKLYEIERNKGISLADEKQQSTATIYKLSSIAKNELARFLRDNRDCSQLPYMQASAGIQKHDETTVPNIYKTNNTFGYVKSLNDSSRSFRNYTQLAASHLSESNTMVALPSNEATVVHKPCPYNEIAVDSTVNSSSATTLMPEETIISFQTMRQSFVPEQKDHKIPAVNGASAGVQISNVDEEKFEPTQVTVTQSSVTEITTESAQWNPAVQFIPPLSGYKMSQNKINNHPKSFGCLTCQFILSNKPFQKISSSTFDNVS